jgi:hypothetical protein
MQSEKALKFTSHAVYLILILFIIYLLETINDGKDVCTGFSSSKPTF